MKRLFVALLVLVGMLAVGGIAPLTGIAAEQEQTTAELQMVNINTASQMELTALHGVGEKLAEAIYAHRESHGAFSSAEDLTKVQGIGEKKLEAMKAQVILE